MVSKCRICKDVGINIVATMISVNWLVFMFLFGFVLASRVAPHRNPTAFSLHSCSRISFLMLKSDYATYM